MDADVVIEKVKECEDSEGYKILVENYISYFKAQRNLLESAKPEEDEYLKGQMAAMRYVMNLPKELTK